MKKTYERYQKLAKPRWAPPAWLFGRVWTVLYVFILVSYGYIAYQFLIKGMPFILALPFILNLFFNLIFTPIQFKLRNLPLATIDVLLTLVTLVWALGAIYPFIPWVTIINIPYLVWICIASVLEIEILLMNSRNNKDVEGPRYTNPMLKVGEMAPLDATVSDASGNQVSLKKKLGSYVVLYAYPKDGTPGCIKEACSIRDIYGEFKALGVPVIGLSADNATSHTKFSEKYDLPFPLWADPEHKLLSSFGVWGKQSFLGKSYMGTSRTTFLMDKQGKIIHIWEHVNPEGHAEQVLNYVGNMLK